MTALLGPQSRIGTRQLIPYDTSSAIYRIATDFLLPEYNNEFGYAVFDRSYFDFGSAPAPIVIGVPVAPASASGVTPLLRATVLDTLAAVSGSAQNPTPIVRPVATLSPATVSTLNPTPIIRPLVTLSTAGLAEPDPIVRITVIDTLAAATAATFDPAFLIGPNVVAIPVMPASASASTPTIQSTVQVTASAASAMAHNPSLKLTVQDVLATALAQTLDPNVVVAEQDLFIDVSLMAVGGSSAIPVIRISALPPLMAGSASSFAPQPKLTVVDTLATGSATTNNPAFLIGPNVVIVPLNPATAASFNPSIRTDVPVPVGASSALFSTPTMREIVQSVLATATGQSFSPSLIARVVGVVAAANASASVPTIIARVIDTLATASALGFAPEFLIGPNAFAVPPMPGSAASFTPFPSSIVRGPYPFGTTFARVGSYGYSGGGLNARMISENKWGDSDHSGTGIDDGIWGPSNATVTSEPSGTNGNRATRLTMNSEGAFDPNYDMYMEFVVLPDRAYPVGSIGHVSFDIRANRSLAPQTSEGDGAGYVFYDATQYEEVPITLDTNWQPVAFDTLPLDGAPGYLDLWLGPQAVPGDWVEVSSLRFILNEDRLTIAATAKPPVANGSADFPVPTTQEGAVFLAIPLATGSGVLLEPLLKSKINGVLAAASGVSIAPTLAAVARPPLAPASGDTFIPTVRARVQATTSAASALGYAPTLTLRVPVPLMQAAGVPFDPDVVESDNSITISVPLTGAAASFFTPSPKNGVQVSVAMASINGNAPTPVIEVYAPTISLGADMKSPIVRSIVLIPNTGAGAQLFDPESTVEIIGSHALATAQAINPKLTLTVTQDVMSVLGQMFAPFVASGSPWAMQFVALARTLFTEATPRTTEADANARSTELEATDRNFDADAVNRRVLAEAKA